MERNKVVRKTRKGTIKVNIEKVQKKPYNYISNYQSSEAIVKTVLDKIISLSIQESNNNVINKKLNNFCYDFIHNQLEPLFEENYMSYTKSKNAQNALFWKRKNPSENEWIEIMEPETVAVDRFEGFRTHFKEIVKHKKIKINQIEEKADNDKNNERKKENEKKNERRNSLAKRNSIIKIDIKQNIKKVVNESKISKSNNKEEKNNQNQNNKSNIKNQMFNFPSSDIPGYDEEFNHEAYDPPNIEKLRKEKEQEIKIKEKETKQRVEMLKIAKKKEEEEKLKQNKKKDKQIDSRKFTFDSNGTIIKFKQYKLDKLTKDFINIKNGIKNEIKPKKKKTLKDKNITLTGNDNDNEIVVEEEVVIRNPEDEEKKEKSKKENTPSKSKTIADINQEKIIPSGSNFKIMLPNIGVVIKEDKKIKEGGREFNKFFNKYSIHDYETILNEYIPLQNKTKLSNNVKKLNLTMNNINIHKRMSESVDNVNANANNKSVTNAQNHFTKTNTKTNNENNINNTNKTFNNNNINNYTLNEYANNNPLLLNTTGNLNSNVNLNVNNDIENNNNSSVYLRTSRGANSFIKNNYNPLMTSEMRSFMNYSKEKIDNSFKNSIMMKKGGTSLKLEFESMNDLRNEKTYYGIKNLKQKNLFGKGFMKNYKIGLIKQPINNSIVSLNKDILTDANWGNKIGVGGEKEEKQENIFFAKHHTKQQVMRELGSSFLSGMKVKLPRVRKVEINK